MNIEQKGQVNSQGVSSTRLVVVRLAWIFFGPLALLFILLTIATRKGSWFGGIDLTYFILLALVVLARWAEQASGMATTVYGDSFTSVHFRRYLLVAIPLMSILWIAAKITGTRV